MYIKSIKVDNFRTLQKERKSFEMEFDKKFQVVAGANNSGKTNLLRALNLFFNQSIEDEKEYNRERDLTFHKGPKATGSPSKTSIEVDLFLEDVDLKKISKLSDFVTENNIIRIKRYFGAPNLELYFSYSDGKFPSEIKMKDGENLVKTGSAILVLLKRIKFIFIPAHSDLPIKINELIADEILPSMVDGYGSAFAKKIKELKRDIDAIDEKTTKILNVKNELMTEKFRTVIDKFPEIKADIPIENYALEVSLEDEKLSSILSKRIKLLVRDAAQNTIDSKGSGIQKMTLITLLEYFSDNNEEKARYTSPFLIWAIDEPESFMQPSLQKEMRKIFEKVSNTNQIIISTHSPKLININNIDNVKLFYLKTEEFESVRKGGKKFFKKETNFYDKNSIDFAGKIKKHLGIEANDGWMLRDKNILFEGSGDIVYFHSTFKAIKGYPLDASNISCNSSENMLNFSELINQQILNKEGEKKMLWCLLDNDESGRNSYKKLKTKRYLKAFKTESLYLSKVGNSNDNYPTMIEDFVIPEVFYEAVLMFIAKKDKKSILKTFNFRNYLKERKKQKRIPMPEFLDNHFDSVIKKWGKFSFKELGVKYGLSLNYQEIINKKDEEEIKNFRRKYPQLNMFLSQFDAANK